MGSKKEINFKNWTYYFYNDIIVIKTFDSKNLKLDKKTYKDLDIYNIGYVTIKKIGCGYDVNSVNPLYLRIDNASGYIEEINEDKYLVFGVKDENKELLYNSWIYKRLPENQIQFRWYFTIKQTIKILSNDYNY